MKRVAACALGVGLALLALCGAWASARGSSAAMIVFSRGSSPGRYDISVVSPTGGRPRPLTHSCGWDWWPDWSPDRTRVAFARACGNGSFDLYVVRASGTGLKRLTHGPALDQWPSWSPDGTRIAFIRGDLTGAELYVVGSDGHGLRRLTTNRVEDFAPAWSPDGTRILFTSNRPGRRGALMTIPAAGGVARPLDGLRGGEPAWSPDGRRVAFARAVHGVARETTNIFVANADGTSVRQLTHERVGTVSHHPSWSADGRAIVFMSNRGADLDRGASLWVVSPATGGLRQLTHSTFEDVDPDW
jgi:Tol biopolymer transport system component